MKHKGFAWCEIVNGQPVCIFPNHKQAILSGAAIIQELVRAAAVEAIRRAVFKRDDYTCQHCGEIAMLDGPNKGDMHEKVWRGKGGLISVINSITLCHSCHINDPVAGHGNRKPQWSNSALPSRNI